MKKIFLLLTISAFIWTSCSDTWDDHYKTKSSEEVSPLTLKEYFESGEAQEYSEFYNLLKETGALEELGRDQNLTVWAVKNANYNRAVIENVTDSMLATYHINNLIYGLSDLKAGLKIPALNKTYFGIVQKDDGMYVNSSKIISSKRFKNGAINEIDGLLEPLANLFEYLNALDDEYSIIRDSIGKKNVKVFDRAHSKPLYTDGSGNIVYDSIFYINNPLLDTAKINGGDDYIMYVPSNDVINECYQNLKAQYQMMAQNFTHKDTVMAIEWIKRAIFFPGVEDDYDDVLDMKSAYNKVWRTSVQQVDKTRPTVLSNGVAYPVTKLKIPNNVILKRVKGLVQNWKYLTEEEKLEYYTMTGASAWSVANGDGSGVTIDGVQYIYPIFRVTAMSVDTLGNPYTGEISAEFYPIDYDSKTGNTTLLRVPPGEYKFYMGFRSGKNPGHPYVDIYFQSESELVDGRIPSYADPVMEDAPVLNSNPWNYDRVNETNTAISSRWDGLGGLVGIVRIPGDEMSTFKIKVKYNKPAAVGGPKTMEIYHWALKPTDNNY